jgi:hypothetical protein
MRIVIVIGLIILCSVTAVGQQLSTETRTQEIVAVFTKFKHEAKEKYGVRKEKYKDIRSEPVVKQNIRDYSGVYETEFGEVINMQVENDGRILATGYETIGASRTFRLDEARLTGSLLTARKVYNTGDMEKFEGVFMNLTERNSPTDKGVTVFGLGVHLATPLEHSGITWDKLFYRRGATFVKLCDVGPQATTLGSQ